MNIAILSRGSGNYSTKRLKEICQKICTDTYMIQGQDELDTIWLENKKNIGITAGASTPEWVIQEVVNKINA